MSAYPFGKLSDRLAHRRLLSTGLLLLVLADIALAYAHSVESLAVGVLLWGLHMGSSQGLLAALVAEATPPDLRGTGYGLFNLISGLSMLLASVLAGWLWVRFGPGYTFGGGASFSLLAVMILSWSKK